MYCEYGFDQASKKTFLGLPAGVLLEAKADGAHMELHRFHTGGGTGKGKPAPIQKTHCPMGSPVA
jgi:hypothetical protein